MSGVTFPFNNVTTPGFSRTESIITPEQLVQRYFFGIDLTDSNGNRIPNETLQHAINSAISLIEHRLDIIIQRTKFVERYDYRQVDYMQYNFISLKKRPLAEVELIRAQFPSSSTLVEYPKDWYVTEKESAQIQLAPTSGSISTVVVNAGGSLGPLIHGTRSQFPHLFEVTYYAGFCADEVPMLINETVGLQAAVRIFEILGDIILGGSAGIASQSVSLDGASTSTATTASAMYSGYSARTEAYNKQLEANFKLLRQYYNGIAMVLI